MSDATRSRLMAAAAIVTVVAVIGAGLASRAGREKRLTALTHEQAIPTVAVIRPTPMAVDGDLTLPASLQAMETAPIYARTSGYVRRWHVDIGDTVRRGQLLAELDAPEVEQQLEAARADLETAIANQQLAATTAQRWNTLLAKDAVSKQEADEKAGDLRARTAIANAARANVARLATLAGFTRITAPFDGIVTTRTAQVGALVTAGNAAAQPLFTIADIRRIRAFVRVPQLYSGEVKPGMAVTMTLPEYASREFPATLTRSAGALEPSSGALLVELQAANADRALKPGAYAQARFPLRGGGKAVTLPPSALIIGEDGVQVALIGSDGKAELRSVTLGRDQGKTVEVVAGLGAGDAVIDSPPESLQTGDPVRRLASKEEQARAAR